MTDLIFYYDKEDNEVKIQHSFQVANLVSVIGQDRYNGMSAQRRLDMITDTPCLVYSTKR